jgi:type II secretory pathway component PulF
MEPDYSPGEVQSPIGGTQWYAYQGHNKDGKTIEVQIFADSHRDATATAHGMNICHGLSTTNKVEHIGSKRDFDEFS